MSQDKDELIAQFIDLRAQGKTLQECSLALNKAVSTLSTWHHAYTYSIQTRRSEWLSREYGISKEAQLDTYNQINKKLKQALANNDLTDLSGKDTVTLLLKVLSEQDQQLNSGRY